MTDTLLFMGGGIFALLLLGFLLSRRFSAPRRNDDVDGEGEGIEDVESLL